MKGRELLLVVLAGLLIGAVAIYVSGPAEQPHPTEPLIFSIENATVIQVHDTDWARRTWFDWDPLNTYAYELIIIAKPR